MRSQYRRSWRGTLSIDFDYGSGSVVGSLAESGEIENGFRCTLRLKEPMWWQQKHDIFVVGPISLLQSSGSTHHWSLTTRWLLLPLTSPIVDRLKRRVDTSWNVVLGARSTSTRLPRTEQCRRSLKTHLFACYTALKVFYVYALYKCTFTCLFTYLLTYLLGRVRTTCSAQPTVRQLQRHADWSTI